MPRKCDGNEQKIVKSYRIEPSVVENVETDWLSMTEFINAMLILHGYMPDPKKEKAA